MATGHYARISFDEATGRYQLRRGRDAGKDQTYFLFGLKQEQLARTLFPLGDLTKPQVRELAERLGLAVAEARQPGDLFCPQRRLCGVHDSYFREQGLPTTPVHGEIVDTAGRVVGEHQGVHHFTVGQRKGLRIAAAEPLYVISTNPAQQRVTVGRNEDLLRVRLLVKEVNWISIAPIKAPVRASVKIRNRHDAAGATLYPCISRRPGRPRGSAF